MTNLTNPYYYDNLDPDFYMYLYPELKLVHNIDTVEKAYEYYLNNETPYVPDRTTFLQDFNHAIYYYFYSSNIDLDNYIEDSVRDQIIDDKERLSIIHYVRRGHLSYLFRNINIDSNFNPYLYKVMHKVTSDITDEELYLNYLNRKDSDEVVVVGNINELTYHIACNLTLSVDNLVIDDTLTVKENLVVQKDAYILGNFGTDATGVYVNGGSIVVNNEYSDINRIFSFHRLSSNSLALGDQLIEAVSYSNGSNLLNITGGDLQINSNLYVKGSLLLETEVTVGSTLSVHDHIYLEGSLSVDDNVYVNNTLITSNLEISGDLKIMGSINTIDTNVILAERFAISNEGSGPALQVTQFGNTDIVHFVDDSQTAFIIKDGGNVGVNIDNPTEKMTVNGNVLIHSNLTTKGTTHLQSNLMVTDAVVLQSTLSVYNNTYLEGQLSVKEVVYFDNNLTTKGTTHLQSNLMVTAAVVLQNTLSVYNNTYLEGQLSVKDVVHINSNLYMRDSVLIGEGLVHNDEYSLQTTKKILVSGTDYISDERFKMNINDINGKDCLDKIKQVEIKEFNLQDDDSEKKVGVIAQKIKTIFPDIVSESYTFLPFINTNVVALTNDTLSKVDFDLDINDTLLIKDDKQNKFYTKILNITSDGIQIDKNDLNVSEKFLIYGKEIKDGMSVDYTQLFCYMLRAFQEIIK